MPDQASPRPPQPPKDDLHVLLEPVLALDPVEAGLTNGLDPSLPSLDDTLQWNPGRNTVVVAPEPTGPAVEPGGEAPRPAAEPPRATPPELSEETKDARRKAAASRHSALHLRRVDQRGVGHPRLRVDARQLAGVQRAALLVACPLREDAEHITARASAVTHGGVKSNHACHPAFSSREVEFPMFATKTAGQGRLAVGVPGPGRNARRSTLRRGRHLPAIRRSRASAAAPAQ